MLECEQTHRNGDFVVVEYLGLAAMGVTLVFMLVGLPVQIVRNFRARSTGELSRTMCTLWLTTLVAWVCYGIANKDRNIVIPNGLGVILVGCLLGQVLYYRRRPVALLFDLDDTLTQSQAYHAQAESYVLDEYGVQLSPEEITRRYAGISDRIQFRELLPHIETQTLVDEKWRKVYELVEQTPLEPMPGMLALVDELYAAGCPIAIASASPREWIERCLAIEFEVPGDANPTATRTRSFGHYFGNRYVSARECTRGKPHPDVYLRARAVAAAQVPLNRCFVVGDARSDVEAGLAAGMRVLYLSPNNTSFDSSPRVMRFGNSEQLAAFIRRELLSSAT